MKYKIVVNARPWRVGNGHILEGTEVAEIEIKDAAVTTQGGAASGYISTVRQITDGMGSGLFRAIPIDSDQSAIAGPAHTAADVLDAEALQKQTQSKAARPTPKKLAEVEDE